VRGAGGGGGILLPTGVGLTGEDQNGGTGLVAQRQGCMPAGTGGRDRIGNGDEAATRALRRGPWLDTGDLGYLAGGELYLTGRVKDIIVRRGRNLHPDETEEAAGQLAGVEHGGVAVFGYSDPGTGTERVVLVAETHLRDTGELAALRRDRRGPGPS